MFLQLFKLSKTLLTGVIWFASSSKFQCNCSLKGMKMYHSLDGLQHFQRDGARNNFIAAVSTLHLLLFIYN